MESVVFRYKSVRAEKARIAAALSKPWRAVLVVTALGFLGLGVALLALVSPLGWALVGLAVVPAMAIEWYNGELQRLTPDKSQKTIDEILSSDILGRLSPQPSPYDIATVVGTVSGGYFFAARFGLTAGFLQNIASKEAKDMSAVWQAAWQLKEQTNSTEISAGILIVALIQQFPEHEGLLAHMKLSMDDLLAGIAWQQHILELVNGQKVPRKTGGIARDWSFGYIPLLTQFGQNISEQIGDSGLVTIKLESHAEALDQLIATFSKQGRQNAVLIGQTGVGKTTVVHAFAEKLLDARQKLPTGLQFSQVFILDASSLIVRAPGRGEIENLVTRILNEAFLAKNIIICLDNAQLFFEEGVGSVDLSNLLLPILEAGRQRIILTMDEQRYLQIGQRNPAVANVLRRVAVDPASQSETMAIMQDQLIMTEFQYHVTYMYQTLAEAYRLSERYIHDLVMPGRAINLLEAAASYPENGLITPTSVQQAIEKTMNIKVGVASDETERSKLLNLETLIHERMINQTRAVTAVSDALRRARAGVRNQDRPIGTFLFLGPTGVGKTELAKALADVYFGGEDKIVRLDLNEFVTQDSVARLIADGADDASSLTARVMKQPFSVVLLDEIEKAHPDVLTTLLQLLDEGILRDVKNREISFRDTIVIATSNAGADRIREYIERGYQLEQFEQQFQDELISSGQFRPEFLNRFDEIVTFRPLSKEELVQVIDLILVGVNKTLAVQKVSVVVAQDAKLLLVDRGYDPRLGARPMRRVVQRAVENTVAKQMLEGTVMPGTTIQITRDQVEQILGSQVTAEQISTNSVYRSL